MGTVFDGAVVTNGDCRFFHPLGLDGQGRAAWHTYRMFFDQGVRGVGIRKRVLRVGAVVSAGAILMMSAGPVEAQTHDGIELVEARLIANSETVVPGRPITLGLHLKMAPGWHTYWEYSGDAGLPVSLDLELPDGFRTTGLQWPVPHRMVEPGDLEVYAYKDEVLLLMRVFPPARMEESEIVINGHSDWLVCKEICLPGEAEVSLTLEVGDQLTPSHTDLFERFQRQLPERLRGRADEPVKVSWSRDEGALLLEVEGSPDWTYDFYPLPSPEVMVGHPETTTSPDNEKTAVVRVPLTLAPDGLRSLQGVLVAEDEASGERRGWSF